MDLVQVSEIKITGKSQGGSVDNYLCTVLFEKGWFPASYVAGGHLIVRFTKHGKDWSDLHGTQNSASGGQLGQKNHESLQKLRTINTWLIFTNYSMRIYLKGNSPLKTVDNSWANHSFWEALTTWLDRYFLWFQVTKSESARLFGAC